MALENTLVFFLSEEVEHSQTADRQYNVFTSIMFKIHYKVKAFCYSIGIPNATTVKFSRAVCMFKI